MSDPLVTGGFKDYSKHKESSREKSHKNQNPESLPRIEKCFFALLS